MTGAVPRPSGAPAAAATPGANPLGGLFGGAAAPAPAGGLFGAVAPAPAAAGGLFGGAAATPAAGGGGLFGAPPATPSLGGGLFGGAPAAPAAGGLFGAPAAGAAGVAAPAARAVRLDMEFEKLPQGDREWLEKLEHRINEWGWRSHQKPEATCGEVRSRRRLKPSLSPLPSTLTCALSPLPSTLSPPR